MGFTKRIEVSSTMPFRGHNDYRILTLEDLRFEVKHMKATCYVVSD